MHVTAKTILGRWSVWLIVVFFLLMLVFGLLVGSGQRGGETYWSNLYLAVPFTFAWLSGISAFFTGSLSLFRKERGILVYVSSLLGLLVLLFMLGEIIFPH